MKKPLLISIIVLIVIAVLAIVYFNKSDKSGTILKPLDKVAPRGTPENGITPPAENANIVAIKNFSFDPQTLKIKKGEKVIWKNNDSAPHSIAGSIIQSNTLSKGDEFNFTFSQAGEYDYYCGVHPSMKGKIIVE